MTAEEPASSQLVVLGASAGGVEALSTLASTLPANFPAPIVIAQHIDPRRASHLGEILQRRSALPVRTVDGRETLTPGVIYVVPANRDVELTNHAVSVRSSTGSPSPSIDRLLRSAAEVFGENLIAVILTGTGSDGAAGARTVKEMGGTVIIQNPATASYPGMPLSLSPTTVDIVANLENIGPLLHELIESGKRPIRPADERTLRVLLDDLRDRSGIDFTSYKTPTIQRRLQRRIAATGAENLSAYLRLLQRDPDEYRRLVASFLIKVTEFFRDPELFQYLRNNVLPGLIEDARRRANEIRLWSAGCATGEEAYSLAILLADVLGDELDRFNVRIFATDLDADAVRFARRGIYPAQALANLPPGMLQRYFVRANSEYEITKRIRGMLIFGQHDLGQRAPFPRIDLTLCRNVLIYFTTELQRRALHLFAFSLRDGGVLVLGKAETAGALGEHFVLEHPQFKVYRRHGDPVLIPPARIRDSTPMRPPQRTLAGQQTSTALPDPVFARAEQEAQRGRLLSERSGETLAQLPVGIVVVDRYYDIQMINPAARRLLGIHVPAVGEDLIHLAQEIPSQQLRTLIDAVLAAEPGQIVEETIKGERPAGETCYLQLIGQRRAAESGSDAPPLAAIVVLEVTASVSQRLQLESDVVSARDQMQRQQAIADRLQAANRQLLAANEELAAANAELRTANEDFLVANEEVQAAIEEAETLNEELQATNEELETLNEELQATVEELNTTNDDLQARRIELEELAVSREAQRQASEQERGLLTGILTSMADALVVFDAGGRIVYTNSAYDTLAGTPGGALAAEDAEGRPLAQDALFQQRAARGETFTVQFTLAGTGGRRFYEAAGRPLVNATGTRGGVVTIREVEPPGSG